MPASGRNPYLLRLIAITKVAKATILIAAGLGALRLVHRGIEENLLRWMQAVRVDPGNRIANTVLSRATGLSTRRLEAIGIGTLLYGALFATEGIGLFLRKQWAEYLTVISTAAFLPVEVYEMIHRPSAVKVIVLLINLLIVVYLIYQLRTARHKHAS